MAVRIRLTRARRHLLSTTAPPPPSHHLALCLNAHRRAKPSHPDLSCPSQLLHDKMHAPPELSAHGHRAAAIAYALAPLRQQTPSSATNAAAAQQLRAFKTQQPFSAPFS